MRTSLLIICITLITGCATKSHEQANLNRAVKKFWPEAEVSVHQIKTAKVCQHGNTYDVNYRVGLLGGIKFQSICLEGFK